MFHPPPAEPNLTQPPTRYQPHPLVKYRQKESRFTKPRTRQVQDEMPKTFCSREVFASKAVLEMFSPPPFLNPMQGSAKELR